MPFFLEINNRALLFPNTPGRPSAMCLRIGLVIKVLVSFLRSMICHFLGLRKKSNEIKKPWDRVLRQTLFRYDP